MDTRLYILAGLFVLVVVALIVLLVTLIRSSRDSSPYPAEPEGVWPMLKPAPAEVVEVDLLSKADDKFARPATGATALLSQPLRTGSWKPHEEAAPVSAQTDDYWDSLIDEPSLLVRSTRPFTEPSTSTATAQSTIHHVSPDKEDELSTMIQELEEEPSAPAPPPPIPAAPEPQAPVPVIPETLPTPVPVTELPPEPAEEQQPLHAPAEEPPPPMPVPVPVIETPQEPLPAQVTVAPETPPAPAPVIEPPFEPVVEPQSSPDIPEEHVLVAPVEMWFGESRVGVKAGTRTYDLFQKYATVIREDYRRVTSGSP